VLARARATAKPGDVFTPEARPAITRLLATIFGGPDGRQLKASVTDETPEQFELLEKEPEASSSDWKLAVFHQPLYSSGDRHGSDLRLREANAISRTGLPVDSGVLTRRKITP